jgi:hypothetical protein
VNFWKVILATVVIFGAGVLTGGLLVNHVDHSYARNLHRPLTNPDTRLQENHDRAQQHPTEIPMPRLAKELGKQFVQQLNDTLKLTPEQHEKIEKIIADGQERNHEIWTNTAPKMREVMQEVNQQIRAELTPEQLKPFEELLKHPSRRPLSGTNAPPANVPGV